MTVSFEVAWALGLIAALARAGGFVMASPVFNRLPVTGRMALSMALGLALARPLAQPPTINFLLSSVVANLAVGLLLAFLTGLLFHAFEIAGGIVDFTSGLSVATLFDPLTGTQNGVFGRTFSLGATALIFVSGADRLLITALDLTTDAVPLGGGLAFPTAAPDFVTDTMSQLFVLAVEIALPAIGALFLIELVLALGARFAPQANVFILGLPAKMMAALTAVSIVILAFPSAADGVVASFEDALKALLGGPIG